MRKVMQTAKTKTHTVDLLPPFTWDADKLATLEEILGEPCRIPLKGCDSWALMINGSRIHTPSYSWLKLRAQKSASTSTQSARHIKFYVEFLLNKTDSRWDADEIPNRVKLPFDHRSKAESHGPHTLADL